ncbi:hypothetical protein EYR41_010876 [Orbilia oligospora]|uniref:Uncharacterized protein n=1 Tax=Orbilia oligospora TaxID=2813651 RepID=A0A7C8K9X3_ORBOL|nr:hypothetical protein TWF751_008708 [Orbilia oligospora]TGJ62921.1 hypothetical protein EYR41_010876 [Orbilia oligospora]
MKLSILSVATFFLAAATSVTSAPLEEVVNMNRLDARQSNIQTIAVFSNTNFGGFRHTIEVTIGKCQIRIRSSSNSAVLQTLCPRDSGITSNPPTSLETIGAHFTANLIAKGLPIPMMLRLRPPVTAAQLRLPGPISRSSGF